MFNILLVMNGSALNRGMNTGLENLVWGLAEQGAKVTVLAGGKQQEKHNYDYPDSVNYCFVGKPLKNPMDFITAYKDLVSSQKFDFVIGWLENIAPMANINITDKPIFVANEGRTPIRSIYFRPTKWLLNRKINPIDYFRYIKAIKNISKSIHTVVGITETVVREVAKYYPIGGVGTEVIHRGVNTKLFVPLERVQSTDTFKILFTGNISSAKGITDLIEALKLVDSHQKIQLDLCGKVEPEYQSWIESEVNSLPNISVIFYGQVDHKAVVRLCNLTSVFCFTSYSEGLGKSLIEAMSCGCAVICSNIDVFKEVVLHEKNGLMVPIKSPELLAQAITRYIDNPELRAMYGKEARKTVVEKFSKEAEINGWLKLLKEIREQSA